MGRRASRSDGGPFRHRTLIAPGLSLAALVRWIGVFALVTGALLIALAFRLRAWGRSGAAMAAI